MSARRRRLAFAGAVVAVGAVAWVLYRAGQGQFAAPPLRRPEAWGSWAAEREPLVAAVAIVRLLAMGAVWYLVGATVVGGALRALGAVRLVAVVDRVTVPALRRLLVATTSVTLAAGFTPAAALAQPAGTGAATTTTTAVDRSRPPPTLTMRLLGAEGAGPAPAAGEATGAAGGTNTDAARSSAPDAAWTVRPGECFWSIADEVLARAWGRAPSDAEIVPYWRSLIEANRHLLKDRANPHLVFPGQVFTLPASPPPPAPTR